MERNANSNYQYVISLELPVRNNFWTTSTSYLLNYQYVTTFELPVRHISWTTST